jgi:hypothetical protein
MIPCMANFNEIEKEHSLRPPPSRRSSGRTSFFGDRCSRKTLKKTMKNESLLPFIYIHGVRLVTSSYYCYIDSMSILKPISKTTMVVGCAVMSFCLRDIK